MRTNTPARFAALAGAVLLAVGLAACSSGGGAPKPSSAAQLVDESPKAAGNLDRLTWAVSSEPATLDWIKDADTSTGTILANVCEGLMRLAPDLSIQPALAESVANPDPLTWVYRLHSGVTFHDGTPLTAADAAFSLQRNLDPAAGSFWGGAYVNVASIRATGPLEVTVKLKQPDALFNSYMSTPAGIVDSEASVKRLGASYGTPKGGVNCVGPYSFASWSPGQSITIVRDDHYFDAAHRAKTKTVEFDFVRDPSAVVNGLLSGSLDGSYEISPAALSRLSSSKAGHVYYGPSTQGYDAIVMNTKGPLGDPIVRKALSMVIDRSAIIKAAVGGAGAEQRAPAVPGSWGYAKSTFQKAWDDISTATFDVAGAKKLLATTTAPTAPIVVATTSSDATTPIIGAAIQAAAEKIGLKVQLRSIPADQYYAVYTDASARKGIDLYLTSWGTDFPDPLQIYQYFQTGNIYNFTGFSDPAYDALVNKAAGDSDPDTRAATVVQAQKIIVDQSLWIPLYAPYNTLFLSARATGAPASYVQLHAPWAASIGAAR